MALDPGGSKYALCFGQQIIELNTLEDLNEKLLAPPIMDIMNTSFREGRLPLSWKEADIVPVPKQRPIQDVNKHLRPISLTPILSKFAEDYVVNDFVMPALLKKIDKKAKWDNTGRRLGLACRETGSSNGRVKTFDVTVRKLYTLHGG